MKLTSDFTALHRCMPLFAAVVLSGFLIAGFFCRLSDKPNSAGMGFMFWLFAFL